MVKYIQSIPNVNVINGTKDFLGQNITRTLNKHIIKFTVFKIQMFINYLKAYRTISATYYFCSVESILTCLANSTCPIVLQEYFH